MGSSCSKKKPDFETDIHDNTTSCFENDSCHNTCCIIQVKNKTPPISPNKINKIEPLVGDKKEKERPVSMPCFHEEPDSLKVDISQI
jgi:hypothetical protein